MMVKRSVVSFVLVSVLGGGAFLMLGTNLCSARTLDNMEAERLTYSALVSDSYHASSYSASKTKNSYLPKKSSRPVAKRAEIRHAAYHPKHSYGATIKRAVYHKAASHLLSSLGRLRHG